MLQTTNQKRSARNGYSMLYMELIGIVCIYTGMYPPWLLAVPDSCARDCEVTSLQKKYVIDDLEIMSKVSPDENLTFGDVSPCSSDSELGDLTVDSD